MFSSFSFSVTRTASVVYIREKQTNIVFYRKVSAYNLEKKLMRTEKTVFHCSVYIKPSMGVVI